jgi:hypothetical protein
VRKVSAVLRLVQEGALVQWMSIVSAVLCLVQEGALVQCLSTVQYTSIHARYTLYEYSTPYLQSIHSVSVQ